MAENYQKGVRLCDIKAHNWQIVPYKNPDGSMLFYLNTLLNGRTRRSMVVSLEELKNLKIFMSERSFD